VRVSLLRVVDVRNYPQAEFDPGPGITVVSGPNGSGKSNLLEAIGLFATLSSPRAGNLAALTRTGADEAGLRLELESGASLEIRLRGGRTLLRAGGAGAQAKSFLGRFKAVLFTPEDLDLVRGSPELRRRALDELIVQLRPAFRGTRSRYDRALRQRNFALRQGRTQDAASYDGPLADAGAHVLEARRDLVAELVPTAVALYDELAGKGTLDVRYVHNAGGEDLRGETLVEHLLGLYARGLSVDVERGTTRIGPHRDDLEISIDGVPARTHASRGEQRSAALALRLAELRLLSGAVLLLDDVLSELDADRRARIFNTVDAGAQVIVATADRGAVPSSVDISGEWTVTGGSLRRERVA
jgi:DNA replication and repair protein RecF